MSRLTSL